MVVYSLHTLIRHAMWQSAIGVMATLKTLNLKRCVGHFFTVRKMKKLVSNQKIKSVLLSHFFNQKTPKKGKARGICSGWILTLVKIMWRISLRHKRPKRPINLNASRPSMGPRRKPRVLPRAHKCSEPTYTDPRLSDLFSGPHRFKTIHPDAPLGRNCSAGQRSQPPSEIT